MLLLELDKKSSLPASYNPSGENPALMTFDEYKEIVNPSGKFHPSSAYDVSLDELNNRDKIVEYPKPLRTIKINGLFIRFRMNTEKINYVRRTPDGKYAKDDSGNYIPYSDDEVKEQGWQKFHYNIAAFNDIDQCIGSATTDEWNCILIQVAKEYRTFGLGTILGKMIRSFAPFYSSGGFTDAGYQNFRRIYREKVRDALRDGLYSRLVRSGELTMERVREIIASAKISEKPVRKELNLAINDPKDWLVMAEHGGFSIYDKKIREVLDDHRYTWAERFILGNILVRINDFHRGGTAGLIVEFGGENDRIRKFLMMCAASYCAYEGCPLAVDQDDMHYVSDADYEIGKTNMDTGSKRTIVKIKNPIDVNLIGYTDKQFRKTFDEYDEFKNGVLELAYSKYS